jgi:hypothetical protein
MSAVGESNYTVGDRNGVMSIEEFCRSQLRH